MLFEYTLQKSKIFVKFHSLFALTNCERTIKLFAYYPHKRKMSKKYNSRQGLWRFVTINLTAIILFSVMKLNSFLVVPYSFVLVQMMNEHICSALFLHRSDQGVPKAFLHQLLPQYISLQRCVAVRENSFFQYCTLLSSNQTLFA